MMHWWNWGYGMGWLLMLLYWAFIIGIVVVVIYVIIALVKKQSPAGSNATSGYSKSVEILKERYAKGEITREEYKQMLKDVKD